MKADLVKRMRATLASRVIAPGSCSFEYGIAESQFKEAADEIERLQKPAMCSICVGAPTSIEGDCLCATDPSLAGTEAGELHGLRAEGLRLQAKLARFGALADELDVPYTHIGSHSAGLSKASGYIKGILADDDPKAALAGDEPG